MIKSQFGSIVLGISLFSACLADEQKPALNQASWGHVSGQVVLEGSLDDPRLQKYFENLTLARPLLLKGPPGAEPQIVHQIPNEQLIVDDKSRGVKNVLVYLKARPEAIHPDYTKQPLAAIELALLNRQFTPRIFGLQVGQPLVMTADQIADEATNFQADFLKNDNFNVLVRTPGPAHRWIPKHSEPLPARIRSNIYTTALAYVIIKDHPYIAVTDKDGKFELKNLPTGSHELIIWHETVGYVARKIMVEVNPNETQTIPQKAITVEQLVK